MWNSTTREIYKNIDLTVVLCFSLHFSPIVPVSELWIWENLCWAEPCLGSRRRWEKEYMYVNSVCCERNSPHPECLKLKEHEEDGGRRTRRRCENSCCVQIRTVGPLGSIESQLWGEAKKKTSGYKHKQMRWARTHTHTHLISVPLSCLSPASSSSLVSKLVRLFSSFILLLVLNNVHCLRRQKSGFMLLVQLWNMSKHMPQVTVVVGFSDLFKEMEWIS